MADYFPHQYREMIGALEARLAEVEAERDRFEQRGDQWKADALAAEARLAEVLAVPACRDVGHVETLHAAAGCCDPYETPCAAYEASVAAAGDRAEDAVHEFTPARGDGLFGCSTNVVDGMEFYRCGLPHDHPVHASGGAAGDDRG